MPKIDVYLNFAGNTEEAFNFYRSVFGGKFATLTRFKDMPKEGGKVAKQEENKILNISLPIGKDIMLMASDTLGSRGQKLVQGNNFYISISPDSKSEADRIFHALSEDGRVILPISDQPWNAYYGSFTDKFGVRWMVNYAYPKKLSETSTVAKAIKKSKPAAKPKTKPAVKTKPKQPAAKKIKAAAGPKTKVKAVKGKGKGKTALSVKKKQKKAAAVTGKQSKPAVLKNKPKAAPALKLKPKRVMSKTQNRKKARPERDLIGAGQGKNR